jgi:DNA-binding MarR family transcriptional regulator/GNAT superfamily N-acetyltransferase
LTKATSGEILKAVATPEPSVPSSIAAATHVRRFNRFYTRRLGLLKAGLLRSPFSLAEVRVLYEVAHLPAPNATTIAEVLDLDPGYLSRLLRSLRERGLWRAQAAPGDRRQHVLALTPKGRKAFRGLNARATSEVATMLRSLRERGLLRAQAAPGDRRQHVLALTPKGRKAFRGLNARATSEVATMLRSLSSSEQENLLASLGTVETLLGDRPGSPAPAKVVLRGLVPGDLGWVVQRHGELYAEEYGWNSDFEKLVAGIVGEFASDPKPGQRCWIATVEGRRAGCIFLVPASAQVARLRLLLVEPWARGHGLGTRLVHACIQAARRGGYRRLTLWTNDVLADARRLYQRAGFRLVKNERHHNFGKALGGQNWELSL